MAELDGNNNILLSPPLPVASPPTYLLIIDSRVSNYQEIINSKQSGVYHIVFDVPERPTKFATLIKNIEDKIEQLGVTAFTSIGLVQHNDKKPTYEMFGRTTDYVKPLIQNVQRDDPEFQSWNSISLFITMLHLKYGIQFFDMMACALYSDPNWKHVIDKLTTLTGVTLRASTDDTGSASLGGDWFLESHTGTNLKSIYFTESIENYNGLLYTSPAASTSGATSKKLILIDSRVKDADVIINSMNDDTYCLVFNYFYDTQATILSKLRFLSGSNRYVLDNFYYEAPTLPTRMDPSGNHCTPCDDFDTNDIQLAPGILENEYLEYTMSGVDVSGGVWPFYSQSSNITIKNPVFFQRAKIGETVTTVPYGTTEVATVPANYKQRPSVLVSDLDAFYDLALTSGEIVGGNTVFECIGIIQHTVQASVGYKLIENYMVSSGETISDPAIVEDVQSRDANLISWAPFAEFIQTLKTIHQMSTLDMMACALYSNPDWKYVIDTLAARENITIRASLDNTGSAADDGNWVLETNNVSLTNVYFTDKIYEWKYVLATYIDSRFNALRWNDSMYATRAYDARLKIAAGTNSFTIEAWYYETTAQTNATVVDMGDYNYTFQIRTIGGGGLNLYNNSTGWLTATSATITPGQWNHVAITRSGSLFTFYVNGIARQTITNSTSLYSNNSTFAIGWQSPDTCLCNRQKTDSVLYDIRLWNVARTATEIQMNRNRIVPANSTGLVANYLCTDNGGTFNDRTANALHTTIQNYNSARWSNSTVPIPNIGFLINNGYSLNTSNTSTALRAFTHFDNITYTDFSGVDLSGVNFRGADLTGCNFTNANLTNTNFENAYLINATTTNAITTGSNILHAVTNLSSYVLNFDGVDDAVNMGIPTWTYSTQFRTSMTVECWFKTTDTNSQKGSSTLVGRYNGSGDHQFLLSMGSAGGVAFATSNTSGTWLQTYSLVPYNDMLWHHAAATYNSATGTSSLYIDGSLVHTLTNASYGLLSNNTTVRLIVGNDHSGTSPNTLTDRQFRGLISDVRVWNVVRSAAEISANYRYRLIGNETGLMGYWKLNQGFGTGWGSYAIALDSTSNRANGTLTGMGATPSGSWVASNINFLSRISTITLGPSNGVYNTTDGSFSFTDPISNSFGDFTYAVTPSSVATISNGSSTTKTIYTTPGATVTIPTLSLFEFPEIASLSSWQIDLSFTVTGGAGTWRALMGDMYNEINSGRGWGMWVSANTPQKIHWSWRDNTIEPAQMTVALGTPYVLTAAQNAGTMTLTLRNMANTYDSSSTISNLVANYLFDNNANDTSTNNNNLTNVSSVTYNTSDYKRGTAAASFNGSNYYQITNDGRFSPDNFTIAFWIKPLATSGTHQAIASCRSGTGIGTLTGWFIYIAPNNNLEFFTGASSSYSGGSVYSNFGGVFQNTWVHIAITLNKSSSACILYINGNSSFTTTRTYVNNTGTNMRIGAGANEDTVNFIVRSGTLMDDFRFYNKVLTAAEVSTLVSPISNIVGWYSFDNNANDASPNNNNLTNTNSVAYNTGDYKRGTAAASFNGGNHFQIANDGRFSPDNFTVAFWVKPVDSAGNYQSIATCRDGYSFRGWMIYINPTNNLEFITGSGSGWSSNADTLLNGIGTINTWVHIAFTLSKSTNTVVAYINGNLQATITRTYTNNISYPLRIGAGGDFSYGELFLRNGSLVDDFRFYNKVLSASEIASIVAGSSYSASFSVGANVLGKGPVTIGGWRSYGGEIFPGTISYASVSVPTNQRVVTLLSGDTPATVTATQNSFLDFSRIARTASLTVNSVVPTFSTTFANMTKTFNHSFALEVPVSNSTGAFTFDSSNVSVATINPPVTINALQFNGTTNFVDFGSNIIELGKSSFTIECWVKTSGTSMGLLNCQDTDTTWESGEKSLYIDGNGVPAFVGYACNWIYSTVAVNDNAWHHIAVTWSFAGGSSGTGAIYIDGINRTSTNYSIYAAYSATTNNLGTFVFGKPNYSETTNFFNGAVCELRIWNIARSAAEIFQNYRRLLVGNETGLVAYNRFNQGIASGANTEINRVENNDLNGGYTGILSGNFTLSGSSSNWVSGVLIRPEYDVNVIGSGSTLITATQASTNIYTSLSTNATLTVTKTAPTIGSLNVPASKNVNDVPFSLTLPTSNTSSTSVITSTASVMVEPSDINALMYGASWRKLGGDIDGEAAGDQSGYSVASSADGTIIAIGARFNNAGLYNRTPPAFYLRTGGSNWRTFIPLSTANTTTNLLAWGPDDQFYTYLTAANEIAKQFSYFAGYWLNATRAVNGQTFSVPAFAGQGSVGTFTFTATSSFPVTSYTGSLTSYNSNTTYTLTAQTDGINAGRIQTDAIYIRTGGSNWRDYVPLSTADTTTNRLGWNPDSQFNNVTVAPSNEIAMQFSYYAGYWLNAARATNGQSFSVPAFAGQGSVGTFTFTATSNYPVTTYTGNLSGYNASTYTLTPQSDGIAAGQLISGDAGHVRVYRYNPGKITSNALGPAGWDQLGGDIDGELPDDYSGTSISLSANGTTLAIGANHNDGTGVSSGHVRVFSYNPSKSLANALGPAGWDKLGGDIDGEVAGDQSGGVDWNPDSVKISADGTVVAIGAAYNDANGIDSGHVRVYRYTPGKGSVITQSDPSFGPIGWTRLGADIDGEAAYDYSGYSIGLSADGTTVAIGAWANDGTGSNAGHVRVYRYTPSKSVAVTNQSDTSFGPIGWNRLGADIDGEALGDRSGTGVALSADGNTVAIGGHFNNSLAGHVRVYRYTPSKTVTVTTQTDASFGPIGWNRLGADIDGETANDLAGDTVAISADGTIVAIGASNNTGSGTNAGHVRVYKYTPSKTVAVTSQTDASFGPIGWTRLGIDIDAEAANDSLSRVALSADGTTLVVGARYNDGTTGNASDNRGHARVYNIPTTNALSYSSSNSAIADICGNLLLIKGVNGSTTITATQTANTITGTLDVSGTTYTLRYNPFAYTSSNTNVATVTSGGAVTVVGEGTTTITASQNATRSYTSGSVSGSLVVSLITPTFGTFTLPSNKSFRDIPFILTAPTSNSPGRFSFESNNTSVATISVNTFTTTSLLARYDTSESSNYILSGSNVTQWSDLTGNGYHLIPNGTGPTLSTIKSITAFDFNSSKGLIRTSVPLSSSITVFMVIKYSTNIGNWGSFMHHGHRDTDWAFERNSWPNAITPHNIQFQSNNVNGPPELSATNNTNYILIGRINGSTREFWRYSDTEASGFATGSGVSIVTGNKSIYVGKSDNNEVCNSTIGEILYYNSSLSNADVSANLLYLQNKWFNGINTPSYVTIVGAGTSTITATQDASGNYASKSVTGILDISPIAPDISAWTIPDVSFGVTPFSLTAPTSESNGRFVYSNSTNTNVATITSAGLVTVVGAGNTTITATQDASGNYASRSVTGTLVVSPIAPTLSAFTISNKNVNDISFNLTAPTSDSSGVFVYSSDASGVATVTSNGLVTIVGVGTANITATQYPSLDGNYTIGSITTSLTVNPVLSNFTVPSDKKYGDSSFNLTNPTSFYNNEPFIFTSSNTLVASIGGIDGRTVSIHKAGTTTITAKQAATDAHPELSISAVLTIAKKIPVITLSTISKNYGDASFNLSPSSTNTDVSGTNGDGLGGGLFSFVSLNSGIVTIFDTSFVGIRGIGSAIIEITQTETANFTNGTANVMATISKGTPILSAFTVSTTRVYNTTTFQALAYPTSVSNGAIQYSSSDTNVATIDSSGIITVLKAGFVNFIATQAATAFYNITTRTSNTMTVTRQILPLSRASPTSAVINKTYGDSYFTVSATNSSNGGTITYETNNPSVAGIVGSNTSGVISVNSVGTAIITANRGQTDQYSSLPITWTVEVARTTTTLTGLSDLSYNVTAPPFTVTASSASNGQVTYSLQDPSSQVLSIHPTTGLVTLLSPGSAVIVASQAQGTLHEAPASITATITVSSAGNSLQGATITNTTSFTNVNLEGASLAGVSITNTTFTAAKLTNANLTNAVIVSANFANADLSGATLSGATITGATFTAVSLKNANLSGAVVTNTVFTGSDLSGANLTGVDASGASFANAKLNNVDLTGANIANVNFTNTSIKGAIIDDVSFSPLQKLQLLKNSDNRDIGQIIIPEVTGTTVLAAISESSPLRSIANLDLTSASVSVAVVIPQTSTSPTDVLPDVVLNVQDSDKFYLPINESEYFQIEGVKYYTSGGVVRNYTTNEAVEVINYNGSPVWLIAGSIVGLVLETNTLGTSSFVVPSRMLLTDITPFMPTTLPTSNSNSPIVYSSSNPNIATIDASSGQITITGNYIGEVIFTATQVQNSTYGPGTKSSNTLIIDRTVHFALTGLNQVFNLSTLALLDASSVNMDATDATSVFYVRLSDINNVFKYYSDSNEINDITADDIKYYVFHRKWPAELKINPSHAMMNKLESLNMLGMGNGSITSEKSLMKHDFIRYIALRLFNTIHGVDLFNNETDLRENAAYLGETVRHNIDSILSGISTTSSSGTMMYDSSGNKYLTNDASGNTNLCRELMRQIAANAPSRFYTNEVNGSGLRNVPFIENDTIRFKVVVQCAASQNVLTGVSEIPSRSYTVKLVLKNTVTNVTNANTPVSDSDMYPNSYPYSSSVTTFAPTSASSSVYNIYSPPAPIPFTRFGFNGWYYTNSTAWVNVAPAVRNHIKWLVPSNTGSSKVADLQYVRFNIKIHNNASLPYLMIYTQEGSSRKYVVFGGSASITNGTSYSLYMNFNSYTREPTIVGYQSAALAYTIGSGAFASSETITSIALESDTNASAGNVDFTLASMTVGELSTTNSVVSEKEYGFEAAVPDTYP